MVGPPHAAPYFRGGTKFLCGVTVTSKPSTQVLPSLRRQASVWRQSTECENAFHWYESLPERIHNYTRQTLVPDAPLGGEKALPLPPTVVL